jgi:hypothetical protein
MIAWWWIVVAVLSTAAFTVLLVAICDMGGEHNPRPRNNTRWEHPGKGRWR